jgi:hypothetical protein
MVINNAGSDVGLKINSTSSGNIMQLQDGGSDVLVVADGGTTTGTFAGTSSLTSVGTLTALTVTGAITANGGLETDTNSTIKDKGRFMQHSNNISWVMGG